MVHRAAALSKVKLIFVSLCKRRIGRKPVSPPLLSTATCTLKREDGLCSGRNANLSTTTSNPLTVFYRWPTMRHFRVVSRFKIYQVSTMFLMLVPMGWWYSVGGISGQTLTYAVSSCVGTTGVLCALSFIFTRVVGELAMDNHQSLLRVSTLTFMGRRRDRSFPLSDIVPLADSQSMVGGAMQRLEIVGESSVFLYSLKYGRVMDPRIMAHVLSTKSL